MGNDEAALKMKDGVSHKAISTRTEDKWNSTVFAGPQKNQTTRKILAKQDAGNAGLYGNKDGSNQWQKKTNLAGALAKKT